MRTHCVYRILISALLLMAGLCLPTYASWSFTGQTSGPSTPTAQDALTYFQNQDWANSAKAYRVITEREPKNGPAWFRLGHSLHSLGKFQEAVEAYHRAVEINKNPVAMYNLACAYARSNDKQNALQWLMRAVRAGFNQPQQVRVDEDLVSLRDDASFKEAIAVAERNANPCGQPVYKQFDFWVGEWNVFVGGSQAGTNSVQKILGGCVVFENWTDMAGRGGKSFNTFNSQKGKWQQTWVDDRGSIIEFFGEGKDGVMAYQAETLGSGGAKLLHRMTFTKLSDNRVRQLWEQSNDGGKTWTVAFDGEYQRKI
jgi:tetratricopeptide (TPR) repeat protein